MRRHEVYWVYWIWILGRTDLITETVALDVWNIADVSKRFTFFKNTL